MTFDLRRLMYSLTTALLTSSVGMKKWGGITWPSLLTSTNTMTEVAFLILLTWSTIDFISARYLSFCEFLDRSRVKIFSSQKSPLTCMLHFEEGKSGLAPGQPLDFISCVHRCRMLSLEDRPNSDNDLIVMWFTFSAKASLV